MSRNYPAIRNSWKPKRMIDMKQKRGKWGKFGKENVENDKTRFLDGLTAGNIRS